MPELDATDLTIAIPTRDRFPILERTLGALKRQTVSGFEVIVVVDGTDQNPPHIPARVIVSEHRGPGAARNIAAHASARKLILFLGDDMVPEPQLVARHLEQHKRQPEPEVAVLGHVDWHPDTGPNRIQRWMDWSGTQFDYAHIAGEDAGWGRFYSSNVSLKRDFFLSVGGFDEEFFFLYEDTDLGWRLHDQGLRLFYEPEAKALHLHGYAWRDVVRRFQQIALSEHTMASKHPWFQPFFLERVRKAATRRRAPRLWPHLVDLVPARTPRLRGLAENRANTRYYQQLAEPYLSAWAGARDLAELKEYLGADYDQARLIDHLHEIERERQAARDEPTFYRTSHAYLYDLTVFAMSPTKVPYLADLRRLVPPGARLLDWGCGIGTDGMRLMEAGYRVGFVDFDNPSTRFLRWKLARRGLAADVYDLDRDEIPGGFDAAYAFDVLEHVDDPFATLAELESRAALVVVNLLEPGPQDTHLHRPLPIPALLDRAAARGIIRYRLYHGRSHLVAYRGSGPPLGRIARLRSSAERALGAVVRSRRR
ncbi:MAG: glycosyltransferase [Actinomycetota bacterium]